MKDKEIIKALECCMSDNPPCTTCKYDGDTITVDECMGELMKDALDLINRQRAEIERLEETKNRLSYNLQAVLDERADHTEAVKEFAERLKKKKLHIEDEGQIFKMVHCYEIDNLVKETVGEG